METFEIISLNPDHSDVDMDKINSYLLKCYQNRIKNTLFIYSRKSGLNSKEIEITKGIILVNGYKYHEY
jgi:hypothetical protein